MRSFKRYGKRGFTLVELMIVVAIIGVLAALAIYGVNRYLATTKTAEAKNTIGAIARAGVAAYERETYNNELIAEGQSSSVAMHALCGTATRVPTSGTPPPNRKYQPITAEGSDFNTGDNLNGWKCLKFSMSEAIYYEYEYNTGVLVAGSGADATGFEATAHGDLNGDGIVSTFSRGARIANGQVKVSSEIFINNEFE
jgi:type IV pilus assembly protein PilA